MQRPHGRWKDTIKMDLREIVCGRDYHGFSEHGIRPSGFINGGKFHSGLLAFELCPSSGILNSSVGDGERSPKIHEFLSVSSGSSGMGNLLISRVTVSFYLRTL
jgi:hypothetical protein